MCTLSSFYNSGRTPYLLPSELFVTTHIANVSKWYQYHLSPFGCDKNNCDNDNGNINSHEKDDYVYITMIKWKSINSRHNRNDHEYNKLSSKILDLHAVQNLSFQSNRWLTQWRYCNLVLSYRNDDTYLWSVLYTAWVSLQVLSIKLMVWCKTAASPLLTHWRYCSIALTHRNDDTYLWPMMYTAWVVNGLQTNGTPVGQKLPIPFVVILNLWILNSQW